MQAQIATNPSAATTSADPSPWGRKMKRSRMKLQTVNDCSVALATLIREARSGLLSTESLSRYANALQVLARLIDGGELEARIEALEAQAKQRPVRRVA